MQHKVNLAEKLGRIDDYYSPRIVGAMNDYKLEVARLKSELVWHRHDETDDFFLVLKGRLTIQLRDRDVDLEDGDLFVVPRGVEHCPKADEEAHILLIEPKGTRTGLAMTNELQLWLESHNGTVLPRKRVRAFVRDLETNDAPIATEVLGALESVSPEASQDRKAEKPQLADSPAPSPHSPE